MKNELRYFPSKCRFSFRSSHVLYAIAVKIKLMQICCYTSAIQDHAAQQDFTFSKSIMEAPQQYVKSVQNQQ